MRARVPQNSPARGNPRRLSCDRGDRAIHACCGVIALNCLKLGMEEWREIRGFPDYEASSLGNVRRCTSRTCGKAGHVLKLSRRHHSGHITVQVWSGGKSKTITVSRLVALAFHGEPPSAELHAAHNDGDPTNNVPSNIRWASAAENCADKLLHGTAQLGEKHPAVVLTEQEVRQIRAKYAEGLSLKTLGRAYGVHFGTIWRIVQRLTWRHVD